MRSLSVASSILLSLLAGAAFAEDSCAVCEDVHFFLARGNNEPYPGRQGMLVEATCDDVKSCGYENFIYSDLYTDLYCQIAYDGAIAGLTQMSAYAQKCPNSKLILAGYSSGGQVATDILAGGGGVLFNGCVQPETPPLDSKIGNQIAAVIVFGDVRHTGNQSYNFGSGSPYNGWFPRNGSNLAQLNTYSDRMRSWCVDTDPICAAHLPNYIEESHLDYYDLDSQSAASWIQSVASITKNDPSFTTAIPTSISGTVQNYATIGTQTPSGTVTLDTTWTNTPTYSPCTSTTYAAITGSTSSSNSTMSSSSASGSTMMSTTSKATTAGGKNGATSPTGAAASKTSSGSSTATASASNGAAAVTVQGGLVALGSMMMAVLLM